MCSLNTSTRAHLGPYLGSRISIQFAPPIAGLSIPRRSDIAWGIFSAVFARHLNLRFITPGRLLSTVQLSPAAVSSSSGRLHHRVAKVAGLVGRITVNHSLITADLDRSCRIRSPPLPPVWLNTTLPPWPPMPRPMATCLLPRFPLKAKREFPSLRLKRSPL